MTKLLRALQQFVGPIASGQSGRRAASAGALLMNDTVWQTHGGAPASHLGEINELQNFFDTWSVRLPRATLSRPPTGSATRITEGGRQ
jgi:hypothetical protein